MGNIPTLFENTWTGRINLEEHPGFRNLMENGQSSLRVGAKTMQIIAIKQWANYSITANLGTVDFLGLNHYTTELVSAKYSQGPTSWYDDQELSTHQDPSWPKSASSWLRVVPWGFRRVLNWIKDTYDNVEILVTENGFSDSGGDDWNDDGRVEYFKSYTNQLLKAVTIDKCNVTGYLGWSLLDNFGKVLS